jgi:hypothetical protein
MGPPLPLGFSSISTAFSNGTLGITAFGIALAFSRAPADKQTAYSISAPPAFNCYFRWTSPVAFSEAVLLRI